MCYKGTNPLMAKFLQWVFFLTPCSELFILSFSLIQKTINGWRTPRYNHDLFYIGPILHRAFPHLRRIIMIDIDLVFRNSTLFIIIKFDHLSKFPSGQMWSNCGMSFKVWVRRPYLPLVSFKFQTFQHSSLNNRRFIWFIWFSLGSSKQISCPHDSLSLGRDLSPYYRATLEGGNILWF